MKGRVLHLLSQRPGHTGSGVFLDSKVRAARIAGWEQRVVVGLPAGGERPRVGGLEPTDVRPLYFGEGELDFPLPGMSDVMPYPSSRFSSLSASQLDAYRRAWREHVGEQIADFRPDLIHSNHVWLLSSLLGDLAGGIPVVTSCQATGLRQMELCPHLTGEVKAGCARSERFLVLHEGHRAELAAALGVEARRIVVLGPAFREDIFSAKGRDPGAAARLLYVGKYSRAKGLPWLLDAFGELRRERPELELHVAGGGAGGEAEALAERMRARAPGVVLHGQLSQEGLAELMRRCALCVLPSFYEGVPLVLVEALACGCHVVATRLPGIESAIAPRAEGAVALVPLPRLSSVDRPRAEDLPAFVAALREALRKQLGATPPAGAGPDIAAALQDLSWSACFERLEAVWRELLPR